MKKCAAFLLPAISLFVAVPLAGIASADAISVNRGACMSQIDPSIKPYQHLNGPLTIVITPDGSVITNTPNGYEGWAGCPS